LEPKQYLDGDEHTLKAASVTAERANIEACPGTGMLPPHSHLLRSLMPEMQVILDRQVPWGIKSLAKNKTEMQKPKPRPPLHSPGKSPAAVHSQSVSSGGTSTWDEGCTPRSCLFPQLGNQTFLPSWRQSCTSLSYLLLLSFCVGFVKHF